MAEIRINLARANQQAQLLDTAATELKSEISKITNEMQSISSYWEGDAATAFKQKLQEQETELKNQCKNLKNIAADIRMVAARLKALEEAAQKAAQAL